MRVQSFGYSFRYITLCSTRQSSQAIRCSTSLAANSSSNITIQNITQNRPFSLSNRILSTQSSHAGKKLWYRSQGTAEFVRRLSEEEKMELIAELDKRKTEDTVMAPPILSSAEIRYVLLFSAVPFIGFGALDNTFMLIAGEYIDITFGTMLGITTMAAAAFGNMVSDVLGIMTAGLVEQTASKLGLKTPQISLEQMSLRSYRWTANIGRCVGVVIGCCIGMWPLFFSKKKERCGADLNLGSLR